MHSTRFTFFFWMSYGSPDLCTYASVVAFVLFLVWLVVVVVVWPVSAWFCGVAGASFVMLVCLLGLCFVWRGFVRLVWLVVRVGWSGWLVVLALGCGRCSCFLVFVGACVLLVLSVAVWCG